MFEYFTGRIAYAPDGGDGGAGGAGEGANAGEGGAANPVAPWQGSTEVWKLGEGEKAVPWYSLIPEPEARAHVESKAYKNPAELALANYNLTRMQRNDPAVVALPGADAKPEDWDAFHMKLGRPATKDAYELKFGEGVKVDEGMVNFGKDLFFEMGLDNARAQKAAEKWNGFVAEQNTAALAKQQEANAQAMDALATKWGNDLEVNRAAGQRAMQALGLSNDLVDRVEANIGTAAIVELLATIGRKSDEGGFVGNGNAGGDPNDPANMTKDQAQARITALRGDAEFDKKFSDAKHPEHKDAVTLIERLHARAARA